MYKKPDMIIPQHRWPPRSGCADNAEEITLYKGTHIDRFGTNDGKYFGIPGEPYIFRSLPWFGFGEYNKTSNDCYNPINMEAKNKFNSFYSQPDKSKNPNYDYHIYKVIKPFKVSKCAIAPAFGFPGGGTQFKSNEKIQDLIDNKFIEEVPYTYIPTFDECSIGGKKYNKFKSKKQKKQQKKTKKIKRNQKTKKNQKKSKK